MSHSDEVFLFLSPDVSRFLAENGIGIEEVVRKTGQAMTVRLGANPAEAASGDKEPVTILLASAAVLAAATPLLRDLLRTLSGREAVIRERRLLPVEDSAGNVIHDAKGETVLHWVDVFKGAPSTPKSQAVRVKGLGIEISFGGR